MRAYDRSFQLVLWYLFWGLIHELFHLAAAWSLNVPFDDVHPYLFLLQAVLGRSITLPGLKDANQTQISIITHAGWLGSLVLALIVAQSTQKGSAARSTALLTLLEAIASDLLGLGIVRTASVTLFCGNFGVIMLHPAWNAEGDRGQTVLDLLEKMIQVTMMRGAQSGGVLAWNVQRKPPSQVRTTGIRCRVVNGKRTDLSKLLRRSVERNVCDVLGRMNPSVQCLLGHTRFATSSKSTFEGTHPHQWTPPSPRRVYPLDDTVFWSSHKPQPIVRTVENYVTHNGDFDFFKVNGHHAELAKVQQWLQVATNHPLPCTVDSAAIAGVIDLLRTAGCFGLSLRYALLIASKTSIVQHEVALPTYKDYEQLGTAYERVLVKFCQNDCLSLTDIKNDPELRMALCLAVQAKLESGFNFSQGPFKRFFWDDVEKHGSSNLLQVVRLTVNAFFDNDLFHATKLFMRDAVGSFGLMVSCSEDAHRQVCFAARGQPMSLAFYPEKGIVCYGSEQAAVKAGLLFDLPPSKVPAPTSEGMSCSNYITNKTCRYDLDDLGGEVVLLDWSGRRGKAEPMISMTTYEESKTGETNVRDRTTALTGNEFLLPLLPDTSDPIQEDLYDIPIVLKRIQTNWRNGGLSRLTAWNMGRKLKERLQARVDGKIPVNGATVDILVTGCEVSLWLAEQFASDLQKSFPKLSIKAISSNKILGVFGQELAVPAIGFPISSHIPDLQDSIVIIVSHSGGTFGPLAIANLLQSVTKNIFVVASEWDTQIGKQLRKVLDDGDCSSLRNSRIFTTDVGVRTAEPCSLTVAATHQLLTQIFEQICLIVLSDFHYRSLSGAMITEKDLGILERCNIDGVLGLEDMVGVRRLNEKSKIEKDLRDAGDLWANHALENSRAYILTFMYIVGTVTSGYPLVSGIAIAAGLQGSRYFYLTRFFDSLIFFFLPQINVTLIRLFQGRNLRHRMVGRTVVIGDIPWVAQAADAFLSKIFACSYSIAGLNVLHGNPADHLVHRHTHRIVRGTLLICGRPDGRLTALTSSECAVNLTVNQASSIQSLGGTCESITIGHNQSKLSLTQRDVCLGTFRPKFLCEKIVGVEDASRSRNRIIMANRHVVAPDFRPKLKRSASSQKSFLRKNWPRSVVSGDDQDESATTNRSTLSLKGLYLTMIQKSSSSLVSEKDDKASTKEQLTVAAMIEERQGCRRLRKISNEMDKDSSGTIDLEEFLEAYQHARTGLSREAMTEIFHEADVDGNGVLDFNEFVQVLRMPEVDIIRTLQRRANRDARGLLQVQPSREDYFGEDLSSTAPSGVGDFAQAQSQQFAMELYESRIASLQRFVAMCVMFHQMGKRVENFFSKYSFGVFGYRMDRTHSILRIATTASPVSGDAVRERMETLKLQSLILGAVRTITGAWLSYHQRKMKALSNPFSNSVPIGTDWEQDVAVTSGSRGRNSCLARKRSSSSGNDHAVAFATAVRSALGY